MMIYINLALLVVFLFLITNGDRFRWWYIFRRTIRRDLTAGLRFLKLSLTMRKIMRQETTVAKSFAQLVRLQPDKVAFFFEDQTWTYRQLNEFSDKIAQVFKDAGYAKGDVTALLMSGCPQFVGIWLAFAKLGVITALVNTNLSKTLLLHTIATAHAKALIFSDEFSDIVQEVEDTLVAQNIQIYEFAEKRECTTKFIHLNTLIDNAKETFSESEWTNSKLSDPLLYIYTSGTTGMPKAAVMTNLRLLLITYLFWYICGLRKTDIIYDCLPLYHTGGGILGVGQSIINGVPVALRRKFSARAFWSDCAKYKCTVAQYIGEMCRYLLAAAENNKDGDYENKTVRLMIGNGLKAQIWSKFVKRFQIENVCEVYGATEGNANIANIDNRVGAVGFTPNIPKFLQPIKVLLLRCTDDGIPIRNENGYCTPCKTNEQGICVGGIDKNKVMSNFVGYSDKKANDSKILQNVFEPNDMYFNSGDILIQDELGYFYFKDRTGDTFRWKGENVATCEVEAIISNIMQLNDAVVYGVEVPNAEGRAGMAAIVDADNKLDMDEFSREIQHNLPAYAMPVFLRIMAELPVTTTFKLKKVDLQKEGFDIHKISDKMFIFDAAQRKYFPLTKQLYEEVISGKRRL